jgi:hypothetical protein
MYKKGLQIGEQMPIKRITEDYLPLMVFYFLLLKKYLLGNIMFKFSAGECNLEKADKQEITKC